MTVLNFESATSTDFVTRALPLFSSTKTLKCSQSCRCDSLTSNKHEGLAVKTWPASLVLTVQGLEHGEQP